MNKLRVLHVDDESDIREVVQIALGLDPDFLTFSCGSGEQALQAASVWSPDIVLIDVMMPGMDGPTTLRRLRQDAKTANIPVVFMTARAQSRELDIFRTLGALGVIQKPFDPMTLASAVRAYLRPEMTRLVCMSKEFLERANRDVAVLVNYGDALDDAGDRLLSLEGIRTIAHNLAGSAGIFGFAEISDASAALEVSVNRVSDGSGTVQEVHSALSDLRNCAGIVIIVEYCAGQSL